MEGEDADRRPDQVQRSRGRDVGRGFPAAREGREINSAEGARVQSRDSVAGHSLMGSGGQGGSVGRRRLLGQRSCSVGHDEHVSLRICQDPKNL